MPIKSSHDTFGTVHIIVNTNNLRHKIYRKLHIYFN